MAEDLFLHFTQAYHFFVSCLYCHCDAKRCWEHPNMLYLIVAHFWGSEWDPWMRSGLLCVGFVLLCTHVCLSPLWIAGVFFSLDRVDLKQQLSVNRDRDNRSIEGQTRSAVIKGKTRQARDFSRGTIFALLLCWLFFPHQFIWWQFYLHWNFGMLQRISAPSVSFPHYLSKNVFIFFATPLNTFLVFRWDHKSEGWIIGKAAIQTGISSHKHLFIMIGCLELNVTI